MNLLFDIGGTNMRFSLSDGERLIGEVKVVNTPLNYQQALLVVKNCFNELKKDIEIEKAAGGIAGVFGEEKSILVNSPNLPKWNAKPIKNELKAVFGVETCLENDADLAGLGEAVFGAGRGYKIVAYITIGTGIGGTRIVDKKIDVSSQGFEPGHQYIDLGGSITGKTLDFENLVSGKAIQERYRRKPDQMQDEKTWSEIAKIVAFGINNAIVFWSPEVVVLGGGVLESLPLGKVTKYLGEILTIFPRIPEIKKSELGDKSGLFGALEYLRQISE